MVFILSFGINAWAQPEFNWSRVEASGVVGLIGFGSDYTRHTTVGGAFDVRLVAGLRVGPEFLYHIGAQSGCGCSRTTRDRDMTLSLMTSYDFKPSGRMTSYVTGGGGMLRSNWGQGWRSESFTASVGGGVKIALSKHIFVAPEIRAGWNPVFQGSVRIGYRF